MGEKTFPITGGCLCGAVRYEADDPPSDVCYCHCRMCQKSCGNPSALCAFVPKATFRYTKGEPKFYRTSDWMERGFCVECGTPLLMRDLTDTHAIYIGTLDHPEEWPPTLGHSGIESRIPWDTIDDGLPCWRTEEDPELIATQGALSKLSERMKAGKLTKAEFSKRKDELLRKGH